MNSELTEDKAKVAFIILITTFVVILVILTYYIYFDNETNNKLNNTLNELNKEIKNNTNKLESNEKKLESNLAKRNKLINDESSNNTNLGVQPNLLDNIKTGNYRNKNTEQVYNLSNNIYTYDDARAVCMAHGGKLATYEQVIDAYKKGANWCNYGWSENQMALFPTQKKEWEKLQQDSESANSCGEWGVNGGYFENKDTLFGANCYGIKPEPKDRERVKPKPVGKRERDMLLRVERFKKEMNDLTVSPFNANLWSEP